ncbi:MAG: helix-turn-helix domain-containing protein [Vicinamibacteria bacterium]
MLETNPGFLFPDRRPLKEMVDDYERKIVLMALELSHWNQRRAASSLGLLPSTLSEKMKRFGLRRVKEETGIQGSPGEAA